MSLSHKLIRMKKHIVTGGARTNPPVASVKELPFASERYLFDAPQF